MRSVQPSPPGGRQRAAELQIPASADAWLDTLHDLYWLHVAGRDPTRLRIVSGLLHGNEPSGLRALHRWLRTTSEPPATDVWVLVGAVRAARTPPRYSQRFLAEDGDLNRCWTVAPSDPRTRQVAALRTAFAESGAEALIDLHNNTGDNPAYGVGCREDSLVLGLVSLFSRRFIHSPLALGALVEAMAPHFPSVTIECGRAGDPRADHVAFHGLERFLALESLEPLQVRAPELECLDDPIRVTLRAGTRFGFAPGPRRDLDLTLDPTLDRHNFRTLAAGAALGWVRGSELPLCAHDATGKDRAPELLRIRGDRLTAARPWVPVMMTTDTEVARSDCLFYIVKPRR